MTNNELSRKVLELLVGREDKRIKFTELVDYFAIDVRTVFKNLFFLEEKGLVHLATRLGDSDSVYPQILMIRLKKTGEELAHDKDKLDFTFPIFEDEEEEEGARMVEADLTFHRALDLLADKIRDEMDGESKNSALEKIESLLRLPFIKDPIT